MLCVGHVNTEDCMILSFSSQVTPSWVRRWLWRRLWPAGLRKGKFLVRISLETSQVCLFSSYSTDQQSYSKIQEN